MLFSVISVFFFFNDTATTEIYTLSLHDALPILSHRLTALLTGTVSGNYARNESVPAGSSAYESYGVTAGLNYKVSRIVSATLSYTNSQYKQEITGQSTRFDRTMVTFTLTAEWN